MFSELRIVNWWLGAIILSSICAQFSSGYFEEKRRPIYLNGLVGSFVVFNCKIQFPLDTPLPYILHWYKDGRNIFSWYDGELSANEPYLGRINMLEKLHGYGVASVNLTAIRDSDQGWYQCRVTFPNRSPNSTRGNGTFFHLAVDGGALLKIPPINITVMEGEPANFNCVLKQPDSSYVLWYKDGDLLTDLNDLFHRSAVAADGSLLINPTNMGDLGEYKCEIHDNNGDSQSANAFLNVQYKAKVIDSPREVYLPYGQPAILNCYFRSNPPLTNLRWEKDGLLFDPYNVQGVFYKHNGSLYFSQVRDSHTGKYTCTPFNELGTAGPSRPINVIVQRPPLITIKPKPVYVTRLGGNVQFQCDARHQNGEHRPMIQWSRKDGRALPLKRITLDNGNITIERVKESDIGIYQCIISNDAAIVSVSTELMVERYPANPPYNLTANSSETAIQLKWEPGLSSVMYHVWYRLVDVQEWQMMDVRPSTTGNEVTIVNLQPGREYEMLVLAKNNYGDGVFSKPCRYFTRNYSGEKFEEQPLQLPIDSFAQLGPPHSLSIYSTPEGHVVSWSPPDYGQDVLRLYIIEWSIKPTHKLHGAGETRNTSFLIAHLDEDEIYEVQVTALSTTDYRAGSVPLEFYVPPYRRMKAVAIGMSIVFLLLIICATIYFSMRKRWIRALKEHQANGL